MLVASTSVFGFNCTTLAAVTWRTPPSRPRASRRSASQTGCRAPSTQCCRSFTQKVVASTTCIQQSFLLGRPR